MLFLAANVSAASFKRTSTYQNLKSYVTMLEGQKDTPSDSEQRNAYSLKLSNLTDHAKTTVFNRFDRGVSKSENTTRRTTRKVIRRLQNKQKRVIRKAGKRFSSDKREATVSYSRTVLSINRKQKTALNTVSRQIRSLKSKIGKTKHPRRQATLRRRIASQTRLSNNLKRKLTRNLAEAKKKLNRTTNRAYRVKKRAVRKAGTAYRRDVRRRRAVEKRNAHQWKQRLDYRRLVEFDLVQVLNEEGHKAISAMPEQ